MCVRAFCFQFLLVADPCRRSSVAFPCSFALREVEAMASMATGSSPTAEGCQGGVAQGAAAVGRQGTSPIPSVSAGGGGCHPNPAGGSPTPKRARMEPMVMPQVIFESFGEQGLHRAMSTLKTQLKTISEYVVAMAGKHNILVDDTASHWRCGKLGSTTSSEP